MTYYFKQPKLLTLKCIQLLTLHRIGIPITSNSVLEKIFYSMCIKIYNTLPKKYNTINKTNLEPLQLLLINKDSTR